jgi:hypothetical protein
MANIVITSTTNTIQASFNDYSSVVGLDKGAWSKEWIISFQLVGSYIKVHIQDEKEFLVSHNGASGSLIVDSVDNVSPTDLNDLYTKLVNLLG